MWNAINSAHARNLECNNRAGCRARSMQDALGMLPVAVMFRAETCEKLATLVPPKTTLGAILHLLGM